MTDQERGLFSKTTWYQAELFWGVINVIFGLLGLYFVYRWGVTLAATDEDTRRILMGDPFYTWFSDDDIILIFAASYLGFKLLYIVFTTAQWEMKMNRTHEELVALQRANITRSKAKMRTLSAARTPGNATRNMNGSTRPEFIS